MLVFRIQRIIQSKPNLEHRITLAGDTHLEEEEDPDPAAQNTFVQGGGGSREHKKTANL